MNCDISKSKLILCEWNAFYFIEIAFISFTLHEIKQCIVFFGTPGSFILRNCLEILMSLKLTQEALNENVLCALCFHCHRSLYRFINVMVIV